MKATVVIVAGVAAALVLAAAEIPNLQTSGLVVHEWGTFTSVAGEDGSGIEWNVLGCKGELPAFVTDRTCRNCKSALGGTVRMETPVMYFYSPSEVTANVKVQFPQGAMTEWYPAGDNRRENVSIALSWNGVKIQPGAPADFPMEKNGNRYYAARATDAAPLTVGDQHEKFLFYRGVGTFPVPLSVRVSGYGQVTVENRAGASVPQAILFDNHEGRVRFRVAGQIDGAAAIEDPALLKEDPFARLRRTLESALVAQGLFPKEAHAMLETWNDSWFEEGSRLIYIVPASVVDEMLPLHIEPAPVQIARVFVGRIELVTPDTKRAIESAVARGDWLGVDRYSRFLGPILQRVYPSDFEKWTQVQVNVAKFQASSGTACR